MNTPGYELDHEPNPAMLHTGDSFENMQFNGPQEMKLIIRGLGSGKVDSATNVSARLLPEAGGDLIKRYGSPRF